MVRKPGNNAVGKVSRWNIALRDLASCIIFGDSMKWTHPLKGRTIKQALAEVLNIDEGDLECNPPAHTTYFGYVLWSGPSNGVAHYHSWDSVKDCLKYGFDVGNNLCVSSMDNDWNRS